MSLLVLVSSRLTHTSLEVRTKSQELWHTILVLISYFAFCCFARNLLFIL